MPLATTCDEQFNIQYNRLVLRLRYKFENWTHLYVFFHRRNQKVLGKNLTIHVAGQRRELLR